MRQTNRCVSHGGTLFPQLSQYTVSVPTAGQVSLLVSLFFVVVHTLSARTAARTTVPVYSICIELPLLHMPDRCCILQRGEKKLELNATDAQVKTRVVEQRLGNSLVHSSNQPRDKSSDNEGASILADVDVYFKPDA